jgi:hypothetical protein
MRSTIPGPYKSAFANDEAIFLFFTVTDRQQTFV